MHCTVIMAMSVNEHFVCCESATSL